MPRRGDEEMRRMVESMIKSKCNRCHGMGFIFKSGNQSTETIACPDCIENAKRKPCDHCNDTGYYGDNGPGISGNKEYQPCDMCYPPIEPSTAIELSIKALSKKQAGIVSFFRLPIPLNAMRAMNTFIEKAYGKGCTITEQPKGWLMVSRRER